MNVDPHGLVPSGHRHYELGVALLSDTETQGLSGNRCLGRWATVAVAVAVAPRLKDGRMPTGSAVAREGTFERRIEADVSG